VISSPPGLRRLAAFTALATVFLIFAGALVTSTGSGLAVPDWPLSYGTLFPPMVGGIFYEHGHRLIAGSVALLTAALAGLAWWKEPRPIVRRLAFLALLAVLAQAVLGGLTVLFLLPTAISVSHAALANLFLCLIVALAVLTRTPSPRPEHLPGPAPATDLPRRAWLALAVMIYIQMLLGALMRHTGAGLAIADFPLAQGRLVPPLSDPGVAIHFMHRVGALAVLALGLVAVPATVRAAHTPPGSRWPAVLLLIALPAQIALGAWTVLGGKPIYPTTLHVVTGSACLALSVRGWLSWRLAAVEAA